MGGVFCVLFSTNSRFSCHHQLHHIPSSLLLKFTPTSRGHRKSFWESRYTNQEGGKWLHQKKWTEALHVGIGSYGALTATQWCLLACDRQAGVEFCFRGQQWHLWHRGLPLQHCPRQSIRLQRFSEPCTQRPIKTAEIKKRAFRQQPDRSNMEWRFSNQWQ